MKDEGCWKKSAVNGKKLSMNCDPGTGSRSTLKNIEVAEDFWMNQEGDLLYLVLSQIFLYLCPNIRARKWVQNLKNN